MVQQLKRARWVSLHKNKRIFCLSPSEHERFKGTVQRYGRGGYLAIHILKGLFKSNNRGKTSYFVTGPVHNLQLKVSALYQVSNFKKQALFQVAVLRVTTIWNIARFFERHCNFNGMLVGCNIPLADLWIL